MDGRRIVRLVAVLGASLMLLVGGAVAHQQPVAPAQPAVPALAGPTRTADIAAAEVATAKTKAAMRRPWAGEKPGAKAGARSGAAAEPAAGAEVRARGPFQWPLAGQPVVTRRFDPPARRWLPGHRGVDLAGEPGAQVHAAGAGTVFFAGMVAGVPVVSIMHSGGLRTTYQPVMPTVSAGERVAAGDPIGVLQAGHAGCTAAACLHWGLRQGEFYLDPLSLLGLGQVRLLPRPGV